MSVFTLPILWNYYYITKPIKYVQDTQPQFVGCNKDKTDMKSGQNGQTKETEKSRQNGQKIRTKPQWQNFRS